jgi:hypothetical protein
MHISVRKKIFIDPRKQLRRFIIRSKTDQKLLRQKFNINTNSNSAGRAKQATQILIRAGFVHHFESCCKCVKLSARNPHCLHLEI